MYPPTVLCDVSLQTENRIFKLITKSSSSTCHLDPTPTTIVKACLPSNISLLTSIIKSSLSIGTVPPSLKFAIIRPTLNKSGLDSGDKNNYRPISNLPFISKCPEMVVASQFQNYLDNNDFNSNLAFAPNIAQKQPWLRSPMTSSVQLIPVCSPSSSSWT